MSGPFLPGTHVEREREAEPYAIWPESAAEIRAAHQRGRDDYKIGRQWQPFAMEFEDDTLRFAYVAGWTAAEQGR